MMINRIGFEPRLPIHQTIKEKPDYKPNNKMAKLPKESMYDRIVRIVEGERDTHDRAHHKKDEVEQRSLDAAKKFKVAK